MSTLNRLKERLRSDVMASQGNCHDTETPEKVFVSVTFERLERVEYMAGVYAATPNEALELAEKMAAGGLALRVAPPLTDGGFRVVEMVATPSVNRDVPPCSDANTANVRERTDRLGGVR